MTCDDIGISCNHCKVLGVFCWIFLNYFFLNYFDSFFCCVDDLFQTSTSSRVVDAASPAHVLTRTPRSLRFPLSFRLYKGDVCFYGSFYGFLEELVAETEAS